MFLPRENAHFVLGPTPVLLLGGAPIHEPLPPLHGPDGRMPVCADWQVTGPAHHVRGGRSR